MAFLFSSDNTRSTAISNLFVFQYGDKRVLAERQLNYHLAMQTCRSLFPYFPRECTITFNTKELDICKNEMTEISEQVWATVVRQLNHVVVMVEPTGSSGDGAATPSPRGRGAYLQRVIYINVDYFGTIAKFTVSISSTIASLIGDVRSRMGEYTGGFGLAFNHNLLDNTKTIRDYSISEGDTLQCYPLLLGRKPVIYLSSPTHMEALVKLSLAAQWDFSAVYPVVPIKPRTASSNEEISWKVEVHPNGDLTELTTGLDVAYLFWEAHTSPNVARPLTPPPSPGFGTSGSTESIDIFNPNTANVSDHDSVVLSIDKITAYLDRALSALCLHTEARTSFITYWLPSLLKHKHVALRFVPQRAFEHAAPLTVSPAPDVVTRIFMVFKGLTDQELGRWSVAANRASEDVRMWQNIVGVDWERARDARLFRVLEWGGMEVFQGLRS